MPMDEICGEIWLSLLLPVRLVEAEMDVDIDIKSLAGLSHALRTYVARKFLNLLLNLPLNAPGPESTSSTSLSLSRTLALALLFRLNWLLFALLL